MMCRLFPAILKKKTTNCRLSGCRKLESARSRGDLKRSTGDERVPLPGRENLLDLPPPCPREELMVSKGRIPSAVASVFFFILLSLSQVAAAKHLPAERSSCQAVDLSPCRDFVTRSTKNPSGTCCLRFKSAVRSRCGCRFPTGGTFLTVEQAQSLGDACKLTSEALGRCFDVSRVMKSGAKFSKQTSTASTGTLQTEENGSGMTNSSMQSPKGISASSNHSLHTDSPCPDCSDGPIDPSSLTPLPPNSP